MVSATRLAAGLAFVFSLAMSATPANAELPGGLFGDAPLIEAINSGSVEKVNAALVDGAPPNQRAIDGTPALVLAVSQHSLEIVTLLVDQGARVDIASNDGTT